MYNPKKHDSQLEEMRDVKIERMMDHYASQTPLQNLEFIVPYMQKSEYVLIIAGAGMSVDSGIPDFRGNEKFWEVFPQYKKDLLEI